SQGPAASAWLIKPSDPLSKDPTVLDGLTARNDISLKNTSAAVFGQLTFKITDAFKIQPGFRVNYDKKVSSRDIRAAAPRAHRAAPVRRQ
ncbi:TonB-dependent receptor, partial [Novosphingobium huizhouense]|uniref:TonB-dependent receptor n=1 Tax=Novosphingobium huizhouense TaxID=2866625 RepID=UPI001CD84DD2